MKKIIALPLTATFVLLANAAVAQTQQPSAPQYVWPGPWHMWGDGYVWPFWWMFPLMMLFFLIVCATIFYFARGMCMGSHHFAPRGWNDPNQSALQILNERFARGEIQKEEYGERKAIILSGGR